MLDRHGLVERRGRLRRRAQGTPLSLGQRPNELYTGLPDIDYPFHDKTIVVTRCGRICLGNKKKNFSQVLAGQAVGIK